MSKRKYHNLKIQVKNDCTFPDEGYNSACQDDSHRNNFLPFDEDVDSILCLQTGGESGNISLFYDARDLQSPDQLELGPPLLESSVCGAEDSVNKSDVWESTLPLQVQVKSEVVVVCPAGGATRPHIEREEEEKKKYLDAVKRHMNEQPSNEDAMGELHDLMSDMSQDSQGTRWQHPADLTRRNYVQRFKPTLMTLEEYEQTLDFKYKRFARVPKIFKREKITACW